jgi:hypothetical protein
MVGEFEPDERSGTFGIRLSFVIELSVVHETRERPTAPCNGSAGCIIAGAVVIVVTLVGRGKLDCINTEFFDAVFDSEVIVVVVDIGPKHA